MTVPVAEGDAQAQKEEEEKRYRQREMIRRAQMGDKSARDEFVEQNMGLVCHVARRFVNRGYELEELIQIGSIGLIKAVENFDTGYEVHFSTYAVYLIQGEIRRFLRDDGPIKVGRTLKENGAKLFKCRQRLLQELGREPTIQELEVATGLGREDIVLALDANAEVDSIDRENFSTTASGGMQEHDRVLDRIVISQLVSGLEKTDRQLIFLRYHEGMTQTQVGRRLNMTQVQISRREKKILANLRKKLE